MSNRLLTRAELGAAIREGLQRQARGEGFAFNCWHTHSIPSVHCIGFADPNAGCVNKWTFMQWRNQYEERAEFYK